MPVSWTRPTGNIDQKGMRETILLAIIGVGATGHVFAQALAQNAGQAPVQAPALEFEVATVKPSPPPEGDLININLGTARNGRLTFGNASLSDCLKFAYGIVSDAQLAGPDWIKSKSVRFDIVAQAAPDASRE